MKKKKRAASPTLGCLFWAALVLVLVAVALAVREPVLRNVRKVLGLSSPAASSAPDTPAATQPGAGGSGAPAAASPAATGTATTQPAASQPAGAAPSTGTGTAAPAAPSPPATVAPRALHTRSARLWFVKVDDEGAIELEPVSRSLPVGDSPLRDNLAALLAGPSAAETDSGVVSLIPAGTVVRSVTMKGDTATIDFSEQFRFNALGIEGLRAELRQVIWVATEFPTVSRVQVLIDGKRVDYLGPEGAAVGSPLGRDSDFQ
ncbi:MAG: GerMN domain-containing protein [Spirochaetes bacterium]|nr:GerMN domain-containing protein [Spirochaetota bacterium]